MKVFVAVLALAFVAQAAPVDRKEDASLKSMYDVGKIVKQVFEKMKEAVEFHLIEGSCAETALLKIQTIMEEFKIELKSCDNQANDEDGEEQCFEAAAEIATSKIDEAYLCASSFKNGST